MLEKTSIPRQNDIQSATLHDATITRSSEVLKASVAPSVEDFGASGGQPVGSTPERTPTLGGGHGAAGEPQTGVGCTRHETPAARYRFDADRHIHLLDGRPLCGTSTLVGIISKPLSYWAAGLAVKEFGCPEPKLLTQWKNGKISKANRALLLEAAGKFPALLDAESVVALWSKAYRAHAVNLDDTAKEGTDTHRDYETYVKNCISFNHGIPTAGAPDCGEPEARFAEWSIENVKQFLWSEAHCFSERLWTGGISDGGAILNEANRLAVFDFKRSKEARYSHFVQVAGYATAIEENGLYTPQGGCISHGITHAKVGALVVVPGGGKVEPQIRYNVNEYKEAFASAACLYRLQNKDFPSKF